MAPEPLGEPMNIPIWLKKKFNQKYLASSSSSYDNHDQLRQQQLGLIIDHEINFVCRSQPLNFGGRLL